MRNSARKGLAQEKLYSEDIERTCERREGEFFPGIGNRGKRRIGVGKVREQSTRFNNKSNTRSEKYMLLQREVDMNM